MKTSEIEKIYDNWYGDAKKSKFEKIQSKWRDLAAFYKAKNIAKYFEPNQSDEILDIGGGTGEVSDQLHKKFAFPKTKLVEISKDAVTYSKNKQGIKKAIEFDGYHIPLPDRSIDFGFSTHVLEHVPNPRKFLQELHRVCKKVFIEIPIDYSENIPTIHLLSYGHVNVFSPSIARFLIESEGFNIEKEFPSNNQRRFNMRYFNHFYNMNNPKNLFSKSLFLIKYLASIFKRFIFKTQPSEYCFICEPNDSFEIVSLVETQKRLNN